MVVVRIHLLHPSSYELNIYTVVFETVQPD